jgi:hypothetical protein
MLGKTPKAPAPATKTQTAKPNGDVLSYANYADKDEKRVHLQVRKSTVDSNLFVLEDADGREA